MVSIAVCDDERCMSEKIEKMAEDFFGKKNTDISVAQYPSGEDLLKSNERIDILFLDIGMQGLDGIETARKLRAHGYKGFLVFITVLKEMVFQSFEVQPFDYLVKPVQEEHFEKTMERLFLSMQDRLSPEKVQQYVEEAKLRYEKTKSFRHDIKNHMMVVKELLQNKNTEAALQYVEGMENLTADISFPVSTNHPVLDILLGNKLGIAEENRIEVQCSLAVPYPCGISDIDFCIILGNALDNAVSACNQVSNGKQKYIHVTGKVQGDFLLMEIENSYTGRRTICNGTGLANIRSAVQKYHGAMEIRAEGEKFVLSILVIIPQQSESISQQAG